MDGLNHFFPPRFLGIRVKTCRSGISLPGTGYLCRFGNDQSRRSPLCIIFGIHFRRNIIRLSRPAAGQRRHDNTIGQFDIAHPQRGQQLQFHHNLLSFHPVKQIRKRSPSHSFPVWTCHFSTSPYSYIKPGESFQANTNIPSPSFFRSYHRPIMQPSHPLVQETVIQNTMIAFSSLTGKTDNIL